MDHQQLPTLEKSFVETVVKEPVSTFGLSKGSEKGDNVAGDIYRLEVHTVSGKTLHLVYKVLPINNPMLRAYAIHKQIFNLEIGIYTTIEENVQQLVKKQGLLPDQDDGGSLPIPQYYSGICEGENDYLVLEDVRATGFTMKDKYIGYNFDEVCVILKELARFHALTYFLIKQEGEKFFSTENKGMDRYLKGWILDNSPEDLKMMQGVFGIGLNVAIKMLDKIDRQLADKVRNGIDVGKAGQIVRQMTELTDKKIFPVILHGDFWSNNILLKYDQDSKPIAAKFVDFQQCRRGNITEDLLYFIFTSTTVNFRQQHLQECLTIYFDTFMGHVSNLKCPQPYGFTKGRLMDLFYEGYIPTYIYMAFAIPLQLGIPAELDHQVNNTDEVETRAEVNGNGHLENGDSPEPGPEEALPGFREKLEQLYTSCSAPMLRLEGITKEFVSLGLF